MEFSKCVYLPQEIFDQPNKPCFKPQGLGLGPVPFVEGLGNGLDVIEQVSQIPDIIEDFVPSGKSFVLSDMTTSLEGLQISKGNEDGKFMYCYDGATEKIRQYNMSTPYDLDTASTTPFFVNLSGITTGPEFDFELSGTGKLLYYVVLDFFKFFLHSVNLDIPWQFISGGGTGPSFDFDIIPVISVVFSTDGLTLFALVGSMPIGSIRQYDLTIPFMVNSMSFSGVSFNLPSGLNGRNIRVTPDGLNVYVSTTNETVHRFELGLPNDLSTISLTVDGILNVSGTIDDIEGIAISSNVTRLYGVDQQNFTVHEWTAPQGTPTPIEVVIP